MKQNEDSALKFVYENEELLREIHANGYAGTDDDMPEAFENWLSNFDIIELKDIIGADKHHNDIIMDARF